MGLGHVSRRLAAVILGAASLSMVVITPAHALPAGDHQSPRMIDVDTPVYVGYNSTLKAYHLYVTGRWRAVCGNSKYCWPAYSDSWDGNIGTDDAVRIRFSDSVAFKKFEVRTYDVCGHRQYAKTTTHATGSFDNAFAAVNDRVFPGWTVSTWTTPTGSGSSADGTCKRSTEPQSSIAGMGGGGAATVAYWADLKGQSFRFDVWVNPLPSQGRCYDRLYVKGGYTHTWSSSGLAWSAGLGYPWGVSVGVGPVSGTKDFTVWQGNDGYDDPDLKTPRVCHH